MSIFTEALSQSFDLEEDKLLLDEALLTESAYTKDELKDKFGTDDLDIINAGNEEDVELKIEEALDMYEGLLNQDVPPAVAKAKVLKKEPPEPIKEGLEEKPLTRRERLEQERKNRWKGYCEAFRKEENFTLDESLDEDKLKYSGPAIKRLATRYGIPSAKFKEALIKGIE